MISSAPEVTSARWLYPNGTGSCSSAGLTPAAEGLVVGYATPPEHGYAAALDVLRGVPPP
ncbi:hypothetical protein GCM10027521_08660 [Amycolatopsis cihanbeyliensis]